MAEKADLHTDQSGETMAMAALLPAPGGRVQGRTQDQQSIGAGR